LGNTPFKDTSLLVSPNSASEHLNSVSDICASVTITNGYADRNPLHC
jgi:hypothetical protein